MGLLDAFWARGGAARVVHRGGRVLVGLPRARRDLEAMHGGVALGTEHEPVAARYRTHRVDEIRVEEQHVGLAVIDDVRDLVAGQAEVDRHEDPAVARDTPEALEKT